MAYPVAYLRRSHATNGHDGNGRISFDVQRAAVLEVAARRGDPEPELIVEWGVSGAAAAGAFGGTGRGGRRRAIHDLRRRIEAGEVSALYAYSLSRLARSTRDLLDLAETCTAHRVPIRLAKEGDIDGTTPSGRLYLTVLAAVATFEAEVAAERGKDRNAAMRDRGAHVGRPPFGWLIGDEGRLVPDPVTGPTVKRVLKLYRQLKSPAKVAQALNDAKIAAPKGGRWADGTIRRILARQPGARMPVTVAGSRAVPAAAFARLIRCWCGSLMTPQRKAYTTRTGEARTWVGYNCTTARYNRGHGRPSRIAEKAMLLAAKTEAQRLRLPELLAIEEKAAASRADLDARRGRIIDALEAGTITRAEAEPRLAKIASQVEAIEAETIIIKVPTIDWTWPPERLNEVLRTLWTDIRLDKALRPTFEWTVPEWRA